jgi:hypothetical protein
MYALFGFESSIRTIYALSQPHARTPVKGPADLRQAFSCFLRHQQRGVPRPDGCELFVDDETTERQLAALFKVDSALNDLAQQEIVGEPFMPGEKIDRMARAREALALLQELDPAYHALLHLVVDRIFFCNSDRAEGGSTSTGVGVVWLVGRKSLHVRDLAELFVHELTHNLMFVDELRHVHYNYALIKQPENFAVSSIIKVRRPLDKVVHSIVVATELLLCRQRFLGERSEVTVHPKSHLLQQDALNALASVFALPNLQDLVRPRVIQILLAAEDAIRCLGGAPDSTARRIMPVLEQAPV